MTAEGGGEGWETTKGGDEGRRRPLPRTTTKATRRSNTARTPNANEGGGGIAPDVVDDGRGCGLLRGVAPLGIPCPPPYIPDDRAVHRRHCRPVKMRCRWNGSNMEWIERELKERGAAAGDERVDDRTTTAGADEIGRRQRSRRGATDDTTTNHCFEEEILWTEQRDSYCRR